MPSGLAFNLMLALAESHKDDHLRDARGRAQAADVRRTRPSRRRAFRSR